MLTPLSPCFHVSLQQNNHPHAQPYTGPAAQHMNTPQRPPQRAQESWESTTEEVGPVAPPPAVQTAKE